MDIVSIRELRQQAGPAAGDFRFHAQLDTVGRKTTKTAKPYYELKFVDAEESLLLRAWDNTAAFSACAGAVAKSFYAVEGQFYHNAERGGIEDDRERIASEAAGGEHVERGKAAAHRTSQE